LSQQQRRITIPRRFSTPMLEIWSMQTRFHQRGGRRAFRLLEHPRFRAAYDFLLLRGESGEADPELGQWWTRFQEVGPEEREAMTRDMPGGGSGKRRRRRRPRRRPPQSQ
jgi:poly(A) polymerase